MVEENTVCFICLEDVEYSNLYKSCDTCGGFCHQSCWYLDREILIGVHGKSTMFCQQFVINY